MALEHRLGMLRWHASRTAEQKAATSLKLSDAAVCRLWVRNGRGNPNPSINSSPGPRKKKMDLNTPIGATTIRKVRRASVLKILKDLAETRPELFEDCIVAGLQAPPPRSAPYLLAALSWIDGRPVSADAVTQDPADDLSHLSTDDLRRRAQRIVEALSEKPRLKELPVMDATVVPNPDDMTPEQLQQEIRIAQLEVDRTNEELRRLKK